MFVRWHWLIYLAVSLCTASADRQRNVSESDGIGSVETSINDTTPDGVEIKTDVDKTTEEVHHQAETCSADDDCRHLGRCVEMDGGKFCQCKNGTSGDLCQTVDECVDNPVRCGTLDDVSCIFDIQSEKATCKCDNESKTYVPDEERCMSPCVKYSDCGRYGYCEHEIGNQTFCACEWGTSGDYCEIIDQCHNKKVDCGDDNSNATCTLGGKGTAYCKCQDLDKQGFDYDAKICKDCDCGDHSSGGCTVRNGKKSCGCQLRYFSNDEGKCQDCECGINSHGCKFENGTKICQCFGGYSPKGDKCEKCDCGSGVSKCEFENNKKVCTCKEGYILSGLSGLCTEMCNATKPCKNGGRCVWNVCSCLKGTSGDFCETIDSCYRKCGWADCLYNVSSQESYCNCPDPSDTFDDYYKHCRVCSCGSYTRSCKFVQGQKVCTCMDAYAERLGECTLCFCKGYSSMYGCHFDDYGKMVCKCLKGFAQVGDECKKCDCGENGDCSLNQYWGTKTCQCHEGYLEYRGTCKECDCGTNGGCFLSYEGTKTCNCHKGYEEFRGTCEACDCGYNGDCKVTSYWGNECTCHSGFGMKDEICTRCDCDPGTSCSFNGYIKKCICPKGYSDDNGSCKACDCGPENSTCTFLSGFQSCQCPEGYTEERKEFSFLEKYCKDIDECEKSSSCPWTTKYVNTPGSYECVCKEGYEPTSKSYNYDIKIHGCKDIDECATKIIPCYGSHTTCVNTLGSYRCECHSGYHVVNRSEEQYISCFEDTRPWRTASIVVGCLFGVIIGGLLIVVRRRCST